MYPCKHVPLGNNMSLGWKNKQTNKQTRGYMKNELPKFTGIRLALERPFPPATAHWGILPLHFFFSSKKNCSVSIHFYMLWKIHEGALGILTLLAIQSEQQGMESVSLVTSEIPSVRQQTFDKRTTVTLGTRSGNPNNLAQGGALWRNVWAPCNVTVTVEASRHGNELNRSTGD